MSIFCCAQIIDFENNAIKKWNTRAAPDAKGLSVIKELVAAISSAIENVTFEQTPFRAWHMKAINAKASALTYLQTANQAHSAPSNKCLICGKDHGGLPCPEMVPSSACNTHEELMGFDHVDKIQTTPYPQWICPPCGNKWGNKECGIATWHNDECGICKTFSFVTEPRDFGHLKKGWDK